MSKFNHNFYLDIRKPLKSGKYSIKVNLYDSELKQTSSFTIKKVAGIEVSSSKKDWEDIWINKDKKDSFGEIVGETVVYGNKFEIRTILKAKQDILNEIISRDNIFTNESIKEAFNKYVKPIRVTTNVYEAFDIYIEKLQKETRWKYAKSFQTTLNNIFRHNNPEIEPSDKLYNIYPFKFEEVTVDWLGNFNRTRGKEVSVSSIGIDMRNIRTVYNLVKSKIKHLKELYPFGKSTEGLFTIPTGQSKNQSLNKDQINKLLTLDTDNLYLQMARDYWVFSYINRGMNLTDIAQLKKGQKEWIRSKTKFTAKKVIKGKLVEHQILDDIIKRHKGTGKYLFDIIDDRDDPETAQKKIDNKNSSLNKQYKNLASMFGFPKEFSYQWARHCYTTNMMSSGLNIKVISESMNHTSIKTTENYIDSLKDEDNKKINDALGI
jgi:integrase